MSMPSRGSSAGVVELRTERLVLRSAQAGDVEAFTRLWTDPQVRRHLGGPVEEPQLSRYRKHFWRQRYLLSVVPADGDTVVGSLFVDPESRRSGRREVSYQLLPEHWGRGYGREAVAAAVDWALREVPSEDPSVVAVTQAANARSRRLLEAVGMRWVEEFTEWGALQTMYAVGREGRGETLRC